MRVLITGGTGYLGQSVVRAFAEARHAPVVFARAASTCELPGEHIDGDIRDRHALERAAAGCDAIVHLAALVSIWRRRRADFDEINVGGLRNVLDVAAATHVARVLYTSSFLALPPRGRDRPLRANDYQRTKVDAEAVAAKAAAEGAPIIRLYPGVVYGPGPLSEGNLIGRLVHDHLRGRLPGLVGADRPWSFAWVEDVARAHVRALEHPDPASAYALGGENAPQMRVFEIVRDRTGRRLPRRIPFALATLLATAAEVQTALLKTPPLLTRGTVAIFREDWSLDSASAQRDLDLVIRPLVEGVETLLANL